MLKIYHNPRCKKSRAGLAHLEASGQGYEIVKYLNEPPDAAQLKKIIKKTGRPAEELVRKQEQVYKEQYKGKTLTEDEWADALAAHPKLLQRPIVETEYKAVLAQPPEAMNPLLK